MIHKFCLQAWFASNKPVRSLDCACLNKQEVVPFEEKNGISGFPEINSCPVIYSKVIRKYIYNNCQLMHDTYFDAVYNDCHVLFLVYLSCEMGDNRGF